MLSGGWVLILDTVYCTLLYPRKIIYKFMSGTTVLMLLKLPTNLQLLSTSFYDSLEDEDGSSADWSTIRCSVLVPSFFATLTCSKLRIPSRPHRAIMALSYKKKNKEIDLEIIDILQGLKSTYLIPWRTWK